MGATLRYFGPYMIQIAAPPPSLDWCLFLDVDGTLIELTDTPFDSRVSASLKSTLQQVAERLCGALALVSGRSIERLDELFDPLRLPSAGLHGLERRPAEGSLQSPGSFNDARLDDARTLLAEAIRSHPGTLLEDKGRTIAVHYRLAPQFEPQMRESVMRVVTLLGAHYHVQAGSMMFEIKPRGFNKGTAIRAFMQEPPFAGRRPVFVGDDLTDIDGLREVDSLGGISIGVGDRVHGQYRFDDPTAVRAWLSTIAGESAVHRA